MTLIPMIYYVHYCIFFGIFIVTHPNSKFRNLSLPYCGK